MERSPTLLTPGPCQTSATVRAAAATEDLNHRDPRYAPLLRETKERLLAIYPKTKDWIPYLLGGSGTAAVEAMVTSLLPAGPTLVLANGYYSARIAEIFAIHHLPHELMEFVWTDAIDLLAVGSQLQSGRFASVVCTHHETTTGRLNDLTALGALCHQAGVELYVDAMSCFGADSIDVTHVAGLAASANKCLHGLPGVAFVLARPEIAERAKTKSPRTYYLHLSRYEGDVPPLTPPIPTLQAFRQALREMPAGGRKRQYQEKLAILKQGFPPLLDPEVSSCTLITTALPTGWTYDAWFEACYQEGFVIYGTKGPLRDQYFQLSVMGETSPEDMTRFLAAAQRILGTLPK